jgi:hypothetical protein
MTTENSKKIKLTFSGRNSQDQTLSICFAVANDNEADFQKLLNNFLDFCTANQGFIKSVDVVSDSETKQTCGATIVLGGNRDLMGNELKNRIPQLSEVSTVLY